MTKLRLVFESYQCQPYCRIWLHTIANGQIWFCIIALSCIWLHNVEYFVWQDMVAYGYIKLHRLAHCCMCYIYLQIIT